MPAVSVEEVFANVGSLKVTLKTILNNTVYQDWAYEDNLAGSSSALAGTGVDGIKYDSNAEVNLSNKQAKNAPSDEIIVGGLTLTQSIGSSFSAEGTTSYGTMTIHNTRTSDEFSLRSWKDKVFEVRVGGTLYEGTSDEVVMAYADYPVWIIGVIDDFRVNQSSIDLTLVPLDSALLNVLPLSTTQLGDSTSEPVPYVVGSVKGLPPRREGNGVFRFHDGAVLTTDPITDELNPSNTDSGSNTLFNNFPAISFGENINYYHELRGLSDTQAATTVSTAGVVWTQVSDTELSESSVDNIKVKCDGGLALSSDGNKVLVSNGGAVANTYTSGMFNWAYEGTGFVNRSGLVTSVSVSGDVIAADIGGRWFKVRTDNSGGSGDVSFTFAETLGKVNMVVRNVITGLQTVTFIDGVPEEGTVVPSGVRGINNPVTFTSLDSKTLAFTYTSTTDAAFLAVWFEKVETYRPATGNVDFYFDSGANDNDLTVTTSNDTQNVEIVRGGGVSSSFIVTVGSGEVSLDMTSVDLIGSGYGANIVESTGNLIITPLPANGVAEVISGVDSLMAALSASNGSFNRWKIQVKMRLVSTELASVKAVILQDGLVYETVTVSDTYQVFETEAFGGPQNLTSPKDALLIGTWRGTLGTIKGVGTEVTNLDENFSIEVDYIRAWPYEGTGLSSAFKVYVPNEDARVELPCYRVADATKYKGKLPNTIAVYDSEGYLTVSPEYSRILMDCNGGESTITLIDAAKKLSLLATGEDLIETDEATSPNVGFALTSRATAIEHLKTLLEPVDWFYQENLADNKLTLKKRYDYQTYPDDFRLTESEIVEGSLTRNGSEPRERQYVVAYDVDLSDHTRSLEVESSIGVLTDLPVRNIKTALKELAPAAATGNLIVRDGSANGLYDFKEVGLNASRTLDQAGVIVHPDVPKSRPAIVTSVTLSTDDKETTVSTKVLQES